MDFTFAELLRSYRQRASLDQFGLATALGVHSNTLSSWERGQYRPRYRELVLRLAEELTLNPVETDQLLRAADFPPAYGTPDPPGARHQLRPPIADFVGRAEETEQLVRALQTAARTGRGAIISGLQGMGGVGKTELAYCVAHQLRAVFPDAQLVVELRGSHPAPLTAAQALEQAIHAFTPGAELPDDLLSLERRYRSLLHGQRALILADDAQDVAQVQPLIPPLGSALLITSRTRFSLPGMMTVDLEQLGEAESITLLRQICPRLGAAEAQATAHACGFLPLALRISGSLLRNNPALSVATYLQRLNDERQRLSQLRDPDAPHLDVAASLALSYAQLDAATQGVFRQLGVMVADFATTLAQAVVVAPPEGDVEAVLHYLLRRNLLMYDAQRGRWHMHDLVRDLARRELEDAKELRATTWRYAQAAVQIGQAAYKQFQEDAYKQFQADGDGIPATLAQFDAERPHIDAARRWAAAHAATPEGDALLLADALSTYSLDSSRYPRRSETIPQLEMALGAARRLGDRQGEATVLSGLGYMSYALGDAKRALGYCEQRLTIAQAIGDRQDEGFALNSLGIFYADLGDPRRAIRCFTQALTTAQENEDASGELSSLINLGYIVIRLGESRQAIAYQEQAIAIFHKMEGCKGSEAAILDNLGLAYLDLGEARRAKAYIEQAIDIYVRMFGDQHTEVMLLPHLGRAALAVGEVEQAIECSSRAFTILRESGERSEEGEALYVLGAGYAALGEQAQAQETFEQALRLFREIGHRHGEAECSWALGLALVGWGDCDQALPLLRAAVAYEGRDRPREGRRARCSGCTAGSRGRPAGGGSPH